VRGVILFEDWGWLIFKSESILSIFSRVFVDFGFNPRDFLSSGREIKGISLEGEEENFSSIQSSYCPIV
jgi:hypothetical protein